VPHLLPLGELIKVLRNLLQEGISIRDMRSILETLADNAAQTKDPGQLTELVRQRLSRQITARRLSENGELAVSVLDPQAEELFRPGAAASDPRALSRVTAALEEATRNALARDEEPVVIVAPDIRRAVAQVALRHIPGLSVLSYREIDASVPLVTRSVIAAKESRA